MAASVNANINVLINTAQATAQLRSLQAQIATTNRAIGSGGGAAAAQQAALTKALMDGANASRMWNARIVPMATATQQFTNALDRGKMSLGQYTRYAASQLPGMSRVFRREFDMMSRVAEQNVRRMNTQYVALGNNAAGAAQAMSLMPTALNKQAAATQVALQRQMMMNRMIDLGSTKLLNWGKNTQWAGRQLMVGFSIPLAMMGAAAAKAFKEIDKAEISFKRVYGNLETTTAEMERNLEAVRELGTEYTKYGKSMASTIDIAARVAATGAQGDALVAGTEQTIRLATLGLMEYDEALDATIALQTAFQVSNEELAPTIDFLNVVENETILTMQDMAAAIPRVAPVIKGLGGDVKDLAVMMTALREGGVSAEQGANAIKSGLGRLINPTKAAREEMAKYGISIDAIAQQNKGDLMGMLNDFSDALARLGDFEQQQVLQKVFGTYQYARLGALFKNLANDSGQAARAMELTSMSVEDLARVSEKELGKIEEATSVKFQAAIEKMKIAIAPIGEQFLKILTPVINIVTQLADKFNGLPDNIKNAITIAIAAIAGIGPIILMVVGLFANGIANIVKFVQMVRKFFARIKGDASAFGYLAQQEAEAAGAAGALGGATDTLTKKFVGQQRALERLIELLSIYSSRLASTATMSLPGVAGAAAGPKVAPMPVPVASPRSFFTPMGRMIPPRKYADGVTGVPGTGNKDTVPALLTPGESVVTKSATKKYGSIISAMNAGTIKMMATAGAASGSLPPARSMMMMGGSSYALNPGAIMAPGNQSAFGMSKSFMTRGPGFINSIVGALVGTAMIVEKEAGVMGKKAQMTASYFNDMEAEVRPAAEGIAQDIRDTWREMSKAEKEAATVDDVIAKARERIQARLVSLSETGVRGAAAAQGASRFVFNPANAADRAKYGDIRAAATVRTPEGKYIDKPLRPGNYGNVERGPSVMSPIKTATALAYGGAYPSSYQYAHLVSERTAGPQIPMQGAALGASPTIKSEMANRLISYQNRSNLFTLDANTERMIRSEYARAATIGATTYTTTQRAEMVAGSQQTIPAVVHNGMNHTANPLFGQAAKDDARLYTTTLQAEIAKANASGFRNPNLIPKAPFAGVQSMDGVRMSTRELTSALIATLGDAKKSLVTAFRQIPAFASQVLIAIQPIFAKLTQVFLELNPWIGKAAQSIRHFFTQLSYTWMGIRSVGWEKLTAIVNSAKSAFETAQIAALLAWDKVKALPAKAKSAYETAMLKTMMAWDSVKRMPAQMKNMVSTFMSDLPRTLQRLKNQVFYRGQDLKGRIAERFAPVREAFTRGAGIAMNPVPRAIAIVTAGMAAQEKFNSAVSKAGQALIPLKDGATKVYESLAAGAQKISNVIQLLADPLGRAVVITTATKAALQKLNAALDFARQKIAPIGRVFTSVVDTVTGIAGKLSKITQLLMDPLGRAVVISTMSKKLTDAFSNAVISVKAGATRLYESLLWGAAKSVIGIENAIASVKTGITNAFNSAVTSVKTGATRLYESLLWGGVKALTGLENAFNTIKTRTVARWNDILASFRSVNLKQAFIDAGKSIKSAATAGAENIKTSLATAGQAIRDAGRIAGAMIQGAGVAAGGVAKGVGGWFGKVNEKTGQTRGQRMGGAANSAVMGLMGLSMAASFAGGEVGEMAQKIMPVTMGLMGLQMILPMLKSPLGLAIVAIGALTAMYVKSRMDLDNLARSAAEAGANLGGLANRTQEMSAATGYTFASQRAKDNLFRLAPEDKESMSKFSEYFESERGTKFLDNLRKLTSADRYKEVAKMITMAIADGMDEETAKAYGYSIAYYLGDAVMQQKLKLDFAAGEFAKGIDGLIDIIEERQNAIDALGGYNPKAVGQSSASRGLANMTGVGKYNTQQSMFAEGVGKAGLGAGVGALALGGGMFAAGTATAIGGTVAGLAAGAALTSWAGPLAIVGAIAGAAIGGLIAWKQYNDQVAILNENVGSAAMTMGNAIQVLGELQGAEQLLLEKRQEGKITAEEYANDLQRIKDIEAKATTNMTAVIESMMMGGVVDTDALQQAMKNQLIFSGFEEGLAGAVSSTITPENIAKALFPGNTLEQVFADQAKKASVSTVMIQSLAGITPENAQQRLSDITSQWAVSAQELLVAAQDGLTVEEAQAILIGKRAAQIVMDGMLAGAEGGVEAYSAGTTPTDYETAGNLAAKALAGEKFVAPEGVTVETTPGSRMQAPEAIITQNGRQYKVTKKQINEDLEAPLTFRQKIAQGKMPEGQQLQFTSSGMVSGAETQQALDLATADTEKMFGDLEFTTEDQELIKEYTSKFGVSMSDFLSDALADQGDVGKQFRENIQWALEQGEDFDWTQLAGLGELGTSNDEIRTAIQAAFDTSEIKLKFPEYDLQDMGTEAQTLADKFGEEWASAVATRQAEGKLPVNEQQAEVGLQAATSVLGSTGMENIAKDTDKMNLLLDLIAKMNSPEFAGMDMDKAITEVFGQDAREDVSLLTENLRQFDTAYSGLGITFGENSQKVIDYFKDTASASKDAGETTEQYVQRQTAAAQGYAEIIKTMPTDITSKLNIDIGDPSTYMEMGPYLQQVIDMWPILSKLDPDIDLKTAIEGGILLTENGKPATAQQIADSVEYVNSLAKKLDKAKTKQAKQKIIVELAMEYTTEGKRGSKERRKAGQALVDQANDLLKDTGKTIDQLPSGSAKQVLDISAALTDSLAPLRAQMANALAEEKAALARAKANPLNEKLWIEAGKASAKVAGISKQMEDARTKAIAQVTSVEMNVPDGGNTSGSGSGGSSGEKPLAGQLRESIKNIQAMTNAIAKIMNQNKGVFKNFIAGPFAPGFIEYLKSQGEAGLKVLKGGLEKIKEAYKLYIKEQMALAKQAAKLMPLTIAGQRQAAAAQQQARQQLANVGIVGDEAQSAILDQFDQGFINLVMKALAKPKRKLTQEERDALKIWADATNKQVTKEAQGMLLDSVGFELDAATLSAQYAGLDLPPEVGARFAELGISVQQFNAGMQDSSSFVYKLYQSLMKLNAVKVLANLRGQIMSVKDALSFVSMTGVSDSVAQVLVDAGYSAEDLAVALAGGNDELLNIYNNAVRLDKLNAMKNIGTQVKNTINSAKIYSNIVSATSGMAGMTPELIKQLQDLGVTADMTAGEIQIYANALMAAQVAQENAKTGTEQTSEALDAWISTYQRAAEALNRKEIRPQEKLIEGYQASIKGFEAEIKALQVLQKPFQDQIKQLEKEISPLEKQIKSLQKAQKPLQDDVTNLQEQEAALTDQYEKRVAALDQVDKINERIAARERSQLSVATALAQGDIYAAAEAAMAARQEEAQAASDETRRALEEDYQNRKNAILDVIKAKEEEIKSIDEQIASLQEIIDAKQESIEGHREKIAEYDEQIAGWQEKIATENDKIAKAQDLIEASKKRQAEYEERIYQAQLLQSMIKQQQAIDEAINRGAYDEAAILAEGQRANLQIADALGVNGFAALAAQTGMDINKMITDFKNAVTKENVQALIDRHKAAMEGAVAASESVTDTAARTAEASDGIGTTAKNFEKSFRTSLEGLGDAVKGFASPENGLPKTLSDALTGLGSNLTVAFNGFIDKMTTTLNGITLNFSEVSFTATGKLGKNEVKVDLSGKPGAAKVSPKLNAADYKLFTGGMVGGDGSRDSIGATLSPGEFVIRKSMVDKYGMPMINSINQGAFSLPRYNVGAAAPQMSKPVGSSNAGIIAPVYNTYSISVPVNQPNASADEIAYKVMTKIKSIESANIRRVNGY